MFYFCFMLFCVTCLMLCYGVIVFVNVLLFVIGVFVNVCYLFLYLLVVFYKLFHVLLIFCV